MSMIILCSPRSGNDNLTLCVQCWELSRAARAVLTIIPHSLHNLMLTPRSARNVENNLAQAAQV